MLATKEGQSSSLCARVESMYSSTRAHAAGREGQNTRLHRRRHRPSITRPRTQDKTRFSQDTGVIARKEEWQIRCELHGARIWQWSSPTDTHASAALLPHAHPQAAAARARPATRSGREGIKPARQSFQKQMAMEEGSQRLSGVGWVSSVLDGQPFVSAMLEPARREPRG